MSTTRVLLLLLVATALPGCEKAMQDMYNEPKYKPLARSELFADGRSARTPPEGSVIARQGTLSGTSGGRLGEAPPLDTPNDFPFPVTMERLRRGRERFDIYCAPCHSPLGDGDGLVPHRGFPNPPSYHTDRLRNVSNRHIYDVITHGSGVMYPYASRVAPEDRWAIIAYIRALQLSQNVPLSTVPESHRQILEREAGRD